VSPFVEFAWHLDDPLFDEKGVPPNTPSWRAIELCHGWGRARSTLIASPPKGTTHSVYWRLVLTVLDG
jgi:hypothetical protein